MDALTHKVLGKLQLLYPGGTIGANMAREFGVHGDDIRDAIHQLRCVNDNGKRYFVLASREGYRLTKDIDEGIKYNEGLRGRALSILEAYGGGKETIQYLMEQQGLVGTLFERV